MSRAKKLIYPLSKVGSGHLTEVGGKNASLGEMLSKLKRKGVRVPDGFATGSRLYWEFIGSNNLSIKIQKKLSDWKSGKLSLQKTGASIRRLILQTEFSPEHKEAIREAYRRLCGEHGKRSMDVAVRSSATAEDLPNASFAGQQETYLNIRGEKALLDACRRCFASLFTDRAIAYRERHGFEHHKVALSIGVQQMVRSDKGASGVIFTLDTESGWPDGILINAIWGLGELIVQGAVEPDEYLVFKPLLAKKKLQPILEKNFGYQEKKMVYGSGSSTVKTVPTTKAERQNLVLNDGEILQLSRWAATIEAHYQRPMDIEWAKDGLTGELYIVQARPETVHSQRSHAQLKQYQLKSKGKCLLTGLSVGKSIATGKVCILKDPSEIKNFIPGTILVTSQTNPDWVPIMKQAAAIVTDHGGRTSHAAIVSRELGLPALVGSKTATRDLKNKQEITVDCSSGSTGRIYQGIAKYAVDSIDLDALPKTKTHVMLNLADPEASLNWWALPSDGIGLARMEFVISNAIKIHPMALVHWKELKGAAVRKQIEELTRGYTDKSEYFVESLARGIAKIAAPHYPQPVIVRLSDFKTNEYAELIGGERFEPKEENPMLGWRGASRYYDEAYLEGFALECRALVKVREEIGLDNVVVMIPFCRTLDEADRVLKVMAQHGLKRGKRGLEVYVMCEIPSNVILAEEFAERFDGFSIGSNDLTQLVLGVDRDSTRIAGLFDENNEAVKRMIHDVIQRAHKKHCHVGICGQAPSDHSHFARFLVEAGIDSISVIPDSFATVKDNVAAAEKKRRT